jgi:transglutaminase-like putative cysteine protease
LKYRISHTTLYNYSQAVDMCQNEARLKPRDFWRQTCNSAYFDISPQPSDIHDRMDFFGNTVTYFAIQHPHTQLRVTAISDVTILPNPNNLDVFNPISWEAVRSLHSNSMITAQSQSQLNQRQSHFDEASEVTKYLFDSPMVSIIPELRDYASSSFLPNRALLEVVHELMTRIYKDFIYDSTFTTIATPISEVLNFRRGVCQDFAHLAIGCLRAFGIPARYISGYIETAPADDNLKLTGCDASHAWFSVYIPNSGWIDFDPTNNTVPLDQHITLAWGRDYSDVAPLKGIAQGGGKHSLSVSVDVVRMT